MNALSDDNDSVKPIEAMKEIPLTKGKIAKVDDSDYDVLSKHNWQALSNPWTNYAVRTDWNKGNPKCIYMHREILGVVKGQEVDHADGDGLNNCRNNIRLATSVQNKWNMKKSNLNSSGFKGVWKASKNRWCAMIKFGGERIYLGTFKKVEDAAQAYREAGRRYFGEFYKEL